VGGDDATTPGDPSDRADLDPLGTEPDPASDEASGVAGEHAAEPPPVPPLVPPPVPPPVPGLLADGATGSLVGGVAPRPAGTTPHAPQGSPAGGVRPATGHSGPHPAAQLPLPRIVAIANQKGGVGKTTTAVNLSAALAELGYRVLVIDLDPQGNATTGLGINARNLEHSVYDVLLHDVPLDACVEPTTLKNLFVVPATIDLAGAEIELVPAFSRELKLRRALAEIDGDFDFTIMDCPPSLGLLTVNGRPDPVRVLRPRGPRSAPSERGPRPREPQPSTDHQRRRAHDVRCEDKIVRTGER
jgi:hypothetical protein